MRATRRYSPLEINSIGFLSSSAGTGLFIQTGMYSGSITRSSRSLIEESSDGRCARFREYWFDIDGHTSAFSGWGE